MTKPCGRPVLHVHGGPGTCTYRRAAGKQRCVWHWLASQPPQVQKAHAERRLMSWRQQHLTPDAATAAWRGRVPASEWPPGERWCTGCQGMVPLFYCTGSRCKAHASEAAHAGRIEREYGIDSTTYAALFKLQGGRCAICGRRPKTLRLAVDHDHKTGEVRGLLCANNENGCNRGVVANLEAAVDNGLAAAQRAVAYLSDPPLRRLAAGRSWERFGIVEAGGGQVGASDDVEPPF